MNNIEKGLINRRLSDSVKRGDLLTLSDDARIKIKEIRDCNGKLYLNNPNRQCKCFSSCGRKRLILEDGQGECCFCDCRVILAINGKEIKYE